MPTNDKDFMDLLTEELNSCEQPKVHDSEHASIEDIVRDMHRVLAGNGGPTRGLIVKVAANNVYTKQLRDKVDGMSDKLDKQVSRCDEIQRAKVEASKVEAAERTTIVRIAKALWENKSFIMTAILALFVYINNIIADNKVTAIQATQPQISHRLLEETIAKVIDVRFKDVDPRVNKHSKEN